MSTLKKTIKVIKKRIKLSSLIMLLLTFSMNSFAWFIYATKVDSSITAKVKAWKVQFVTGEDEIVEYVNFTIPVMYPGMATYTDMITVSNDGETSANVSYEILSVDIMGSLYEADGVTFTSQMLESMLRNDYPFKIIFGFSSLSIGSGGSGTFSLSASWAYETGNDATDTYWGNQAYNYMNAHPDTPMITLEVKISAVQPPDDDD